MIYISTGGFKYQTAYESSKFLVENGFNAIELSGGVYKKNQLQMLSKLQNENDIVFKVHNYFPPPKNPFVFNLGSLNKDIAKLSIQHVKNALDCSVELGSDVFSFHAGFLLDPQVKELGQTISERHLYNRNESMMRFIDRVIDLSEYAFSKKVSLLIENNVISISNYKQFSGDPLLMTGTNEAKYIMENTPENVNLLVDVGHLKVSSNSLNFIGFDFLNICKKWIKAYHLSENNGEEDENKEFNNNSWFWENIINDLDYYSIEVYTPSIDILTDQYNIAKSKVYKS